MVLFQSNVFMSLRGLVKGVSIGWSFLDDLWFIYNLPSTWHSSPHLPLVGVVVVFKGGGGAWEDRANQRVTNVHLLFSVPNKKGLEATKLCEANLAFVDNPSFKHIFTLQETFTELAAISVIIPAKSGQMWSQFETRFRYGQFFISRTCDWA